MTLNQLTAEEDTVLRNLLERNSYWPSRLAVGKRLVELSSGILRLNPKKSYIALQPLGAEHSARRNAISLLREGVSFAVADWTSESDAEKLSFKTARREKHKTIKKLCFPLLDLDTVNNHVLFFTELTLDSARVITGGKA